jgi:hypothetical protein
LRPRVDLHLIAETLRQLRDSAYFERKLYDFTDHLIGAIEHVLTNPGTYDLAVEAEFAEQMRVVQSYLSGSTNNEVPYEVVYCLGDALRRWGRPDAVVVTYLTEDQESFHLLPLDPWSFIQQAITGYNAGGFTLPVVMMGVPRLYAHKPLFCVPLFHELGHFVDLGQRVSQASLLLNPTSFSPAGGDELHHRQEYFADLFCASFVGRSSVSALEAIAPAQPASYTHPATAERVRVVEALLGGRSDPIIDAFQTALVRLGLPALQVAFAPVAVTADFDDVRTFVPSGIEEVYGLFDSAWNYLFDAIDNSRNPWNFQSASAGDIANLTNDLTEKSIRNFAIRRMWDDASSRI